MEWKDHHRAEWRTFKHNILHETLQGVFSVLCPPQGWYLFQEPHPPSLMFPAICNMANIHRFFLDMIHLRVSFLPCLHPTECPYLSPSRSTAVQFYLVTVKWLMIHNHMLLPGRCKLSSANMLQKQRKECMQNMKVKKFTTSK